MNAVRKIIGLILIVFFGLPLLFGMIWAVGLIRATVSPEFLTDLPRQIITEIPAKADEIFRDAQSEQFITDNGTRTWFQAAAKTGISPKELMEKSGLLEWMSGELSGSLRQIGQVLRGERRPRPIVINLRPLKEALLSPEVDRFLEATLNNLPACDEQGQKTWKEIADFGPNHRELPACRPDLPVAKQALLEARARAVGDINSEVKVFEDAYHFPVFPLGLSHTITLLSYLLFLIPAVFIFLGAVIADSSPAGFLRWSGVSIFAGGIPALLLALAVKYFSLWAIGGGAFYWHDHWTSELGDLVFDKLKGIPERIVDQLFSPVIMVAVIICIAGVVLFALSYSVRNRSRKTQQPVPSSPQTPAGKEVPPKSSNFQANPNEPETPKS
jgi:hypothetical protein